jgi:hypothetical protein
VTSKTISPRQLALIDGNPFDLAQAEQTPIDNPSRVAKDAPLTCWKCRGDMNKGLMGQRSTPLLEVAFCAIEDQRESTVSVCPIHSLEEAA